MNMSFHDKLIHELTAMDRRDSAKKGYNPYALAIMFNAAKDVTDAKSFADAFNATRGLHRVARNLNLPLEVKNGRWLLESEV